MQALGLVQERREKILAFFLFKEHFYSLNKKIPPQCQNKIGTVAFMFIPKNHNIVVSVTGYFKPMIFDRIEYIEKNIVESVIK